MEEKETLRQRSAMAPLGGDKKFNEMSVIFPLLTLYTLVYLGLMIYDFVAKDAFTLPSEMMAVYVALLGAYAADKEIRRWVGSSFDSKFGSVFVYGWLLFFLVAFVVKSFRAEYTLPNDLLKVSLEVIGIFFGSKVSKKIYETKTGKELAVAMSRQDVVVELIKKNGHVKSSDVAKALEISNITARRLMNGLETKGMVKQEGSFKGAYYILNQK